jgi:4,5-DOPA dioxygenase extradiol
VTRVEWQPPSPMTVPSASGFVPADGEQLPLPPHPSGTSAPPSPVLTFAGRNRVGRFHVGRRFRLADSRNPDRTHVGRDQRRRDDENRAGEKYPRGEALASTTGVGGVVHESRYHSIRGVRLRDIAPFLGFNRAADAVDSLRHHNTTMTMPAIYLGHGAPPLLDDQKWMGELAAWADELPRPTSILIVSAHWESAPLGIGSTQPAAPLIYDFGGFDPKYYRLQYPSPGAPDLAEKVAALMPDREQVAFTNRGLDHGAYVPLMAMYPQADIPVLQVSLPTLDPDRLIDLGRRLRPLRDEGVLIVGSGFLTHGLPFLRDFRVDAPPPGWSAEFDAWAAEAFANGDIEALANFWHTAPGMPYAHPTVEHFAPLFVTLGASTNPEDPALQTITGFFLGLSKRSIQVA